MILVGRNPKNLMSCPDLICAFACPRVVFLVAPENNIFDNYIRGVEQEGLPN